MKPSAQVGDGRPGGCFREFSIGRAVENGFRLYFGDGADEGFRHLDVLIGLVVERAVWLDVVELWVDGEDAH